MPSRLSLLALFFGAPLLLLSVLTNSWWSVDEGRLSLSAGLTKIKVCGGLLNCQAVSYSVFDANLERSEEATAALTVASGESEIAIGESYAWAGTSVFWLSILGSIIVLVFYKTASTDDPWRPAAIAVLVVIGLAALLAVVFVVKKPNVIVRVMPLGYGFSFFAFFAGAGAIGYGTIAEAFGPNAAIDGGTASWSPRDSRGVGAAAPTSSQAQSAAAPSSGQGCQQCGGTPTFREDVGCLVCKDCGVLI